MIKVLLEALGEIGGGGSGSAVSEMSRSFGLGLSRGALGTPPPPGHPWGP